MSAVSDELALLASALADAGIPATTNPAAIWPLLAREPVAALVERPRNLQLVGLAGAAMQFDAVAFLLSRGPDSEAEPRLQERLVLAIQVLEADEPAQPDRLTAGDVSVPGYRITSGRTVALT